MAKAWKGYTFALFIIIWMAFKRRRYKIACRLGAQVIYRAEFSFAEEKK